MGSLAWQYYNRSCTVEILHLYILPNKLILVVSMQFRMYNYGSSSKVYNQVFCNSDRKQLRNIQFYCIFADKSHLNVFVKQLSVVWLNGWFISEVKWRFLLYSLAQVVMCCWSCPNLSSDSVPVQWATLSYAQNCCMNGKLMAAHFFAISRFWNWN